MDSWEFFPRKGAGAAIYSGNRNLRQIPSFSRVAQQQLALWRELLARGAAGPDVYGIDVIWPNMLGEYFIDLKPYFADQVSAPSLRIRERQSASQWIAVLVQCQFGGAVPFVLPVLFAALN
jgi:hypothetical protein